jgi:Na+/glutamate symporter
LMVGVLGNLTMNMLSATCLAVQLQFFGKTLVNSSSFYLVVTIPLSIVTTTVVALSLA